MESNPEVTSFIGNIRNTISKLPGVEAWAQGGLPGYMEWMGRTLSDPSMGALPGVGPFGFRPVNPGPALRALKGVVGMEDAAYPGQAIIPPTLKAGGVMVDSPVPQQVGKEFMRNSPTGLSAYIHSLQSAIDQLKQSLGPAAEHMSFKPKK